MRRVYDQDRDPRGPKPLDQTPCMKGQLMCDVRVSEFSYWTLRWKTTINRHKMREKLMQNI